MDLKDSVFAVLQSDSAPTCAYPTVIRSPSAAASFFSPSEEASAAVVSSALVSAGAAVVYDSAGLLVHAVADIATAAANATDKNLFFI